MPKALNKPHDNLSILNPGNEAKRAPLGPYPNPGVEIKLNPLPQAARPEVYPVSYKPVEDLSKVTKPNQPEFSRVGGRWKKTEK